MVLTAGAVVLVGMVMAALYFSHEAAEDADAAIQAVRLNNRALRFFGAIHDAETGQRGYLLTGDTEYLEPFNTARDTALNGFQALAPELRSLGLPEGRLVEFDRLLREKFAELRQTIDLRRNGRTQEALAIVRSGSGKRQMDQIREVMADIEALGIANSAARVATLHTVTSWLSIFIAVSAALLVVIVGGALRLIVSHARQLERAREALSRANETLEEKVSIRTERLQRMNSEVQSYAYIVGHDLRAPLVNIMGFTEELDRSADAFRAYIAKADGGDDLDFKAAKMAVDEEIPEALGFIRTSTERMDKLINQILVLARAGTRTLHAERFAIRDVVAEAVDSLRHQMLDRDVEAEISERLPEVVSDRVALQQVLGNLLDNAVKYSEPSRKGNIRIRGWQSGQTVFIEVRDNGRGIAASDLERIFELFRRSGAQNQPGDGVGLAHVRALTRRLGGDVKVRSALGEGTTFLVTVAADLRNEKKDDN